MTFFHESEVQEIGSEFWDIPLNPNADQHIFPDNISWFESGRAALYAIIQQIRLDRSLQSIALPSWCCHSMIEPFLANGIKVIFYPVYRNASGQLIQDLKHLPACDALYIMNYFGYESEPTQIYFDGIVIQDMTHSIFSSAKSIADYSFGSLRKWAGFWSGGFAWSKKKNEFILKKTAVDNHYIDLRRCAMRQKKEYILGQRRDQEYLSIFKEAECMLDTRFGCAASNRDILSAGLLDVPLLCQRRRSNAAYLLEALSDLALHPVLGENDVPLFVPILVEHGKRDMLQQFLIAHRIYCPTHWPISSIHKLTAQTEAIYQQELSLVCDQRYSQKDMERIITTIYSFLGGEGK